MRKVLHLIPYDGIGGVEEAARSMAADPSRPGIDFALRFLFPNVRSRAQRLATFNPLRILAEARGIAAEAPDLLIVSLWRAALTGCLVKLLNRRVRLVLFVHNSADAHGLDFLATRAALRLADAVWTDSAASVQNRFRRAPRQPVTTISYLAHKLAPLPAPPAGTPPAPVFAFWGRLSAQKNLSRALALFAALRDNHPDARFLIIGPDGGQQALLQRDVAARGLSDAVTFAGPRPFDDIPAAVAEAGARFYLQTSTYEGMALSVTEAMQLGLVPVVTPVGEIARYCRDGDNAVLVGDATGPDAVPAGLHALLTDGAAYASHRAGAVATWAGADAYTPSVYAAIETLVPPAHTE